MVVLMMMIFGAVVVGTQAGFACPDWPLCHGKLIPSLDDPLVLIEWGHRLTSAAGGLLILITAWTAWRKRKEAPLMKKLAIFIVASLALQGLAGAAIVKFKLPGYMTTIDLTNGMILVSLFVILLAYSVRGKELQTRRTNEERDSKMNALFFPAVTMVGVTLFQVVVGGLFRHTGAGEALFGRNDYLRSHDQYTMPSDAFANAFLMFHIMVGVMVTAVLIWLLAQAIRKRVLLAPAVALLVVVLIQMVLGFVTLGTELSLVVVTAHMVGAALTTVFSVYIGARARFARTVHLTAGAVAGGKGRSHSASSSTVSLGTN
ncbi:MAG TPA: COX15/CtaA family protein [Bacilli bacterium]|nr:COX15/CtaA family protein [Bacilli bacterium]